MKVGDYVRTEYGISKIKEYEAKKDDDNCYYLDKNILDDDDYLGNCLYDYKYYLKQVIKSSPNIIDLIEVGDYVNGYKVIDIAQAPEKALYLNDISQKGALIPRTNKDIKSIVTKEQFESMEYKVKE